MDQNSFAPEYDIIVDGTPIPDEVRQSFIEAVVTTEVNTSNSFTLTFGNAFPHLPWTAGDWRNIIKIGSKVDIRLGFVSATKSVLIGEVVRLRCDYPRNTPPTFLLEGHSKLHRLQGPRRSRSFLDSTMSDMVVAVGSDAGVSIETDSSDIKFPYYLQSNQTDLEFILGCARELNFELLADGTTVRFRAPKTNASAVATLKWGDDLLDFRECVDSAAPVTKVEVRGYDPKTKQSFVGAAANGDQTSKLGKLSGATAVRQAFGDRTEVVVDRNPVSLEHATQIAKAVLTRRMMDFVTGAAVTTGNSELKAGVVVALKGLGAALDGSYYITKCVHRFNRNGFFTDFSVKRSDLS